MRIVQVRVIMHGTCFYANMQQVHITFAVSSFHITTPEK
uniref:Uncharacterized protein n=1 Tax=Arundo donax TaxID=35708 RepID=A0A0A8YAL8_ARUDO